MLAHELRNPLSAISNAASIGRLPTCSEDDRRWSHDLIERQAKHLGRLIDDLLDISRITRGKIALRREPASISRILSHAVESARPLIDARGHELDVAIAQGLPPVLADVTRVEQIAA